MEAKVKVTGKGMHYISEGVGLKKMCSDCLVL